MQNLDNRVRTVLEAVVPIDVAAAATAPGTNIGDNVVEAIQVTYNNGTANGQAIVSINERLDLNPVMGTASYASEQIGAGIVDAI